MEIIISQPWNKQNLSSVFNPQSDGQTEWTNQTLEQCLQIYADPGQTNWVQNLMLAEIVYNSIFHNSIKMTPFMETCDFNPLTNVDTKLIEETLPKVEDWLLQLKDTQTWVKLELDWTAKDMIKHANWKQQCGISCWWSSLF